MAHTVPAPMIYKKKSFLFVLIANQKSTGIRLNAALIFLQLLSSRQKVEAANSGVKISRKGKKAQRCRKRISHKECKRDSKTCFGKEFLVNLVYCSCHCG